jgi:hypothetical protein
MKGTAATATTENVLLAASLEMVGQSSSWVLDDALPPPTHANVACWRQLCGVLSAAKGRGVADGQWPTDLAPPRPTLRALVDRGLIVRRKRAWHLKRRSGPRPRGPLQLCGRLQVQPRREICAEWVVGQHPTAVGRAERGRDTMLDNRCLRRVPRCE